MTISATSQGLKPGVCTSSNRPANPFDGMMIYETDTNLVRIWNGSAWKTLAYSDATSGAVLQIVSATKTNAFSTTSTTFVDITDLSVSITPTSTSNKILVVASVSGIGTDVSNAGSTGIVLVRGSTQIAVNTDATEKFSIHLSQRLVSSSEFTLNGAIVHLDSPSTTSSTTYKIQGKAVAGTLYVNRSTSGYDGSVSSITVMEIAG